MDVGLFDDFAGSPPDIPASVEVVRTSGFSSSGIGIAIYVYDSAVTSTTVAANPLTQFLADDGRGFRLSVHQDVTGLMFGAVEGGDCADAFEAWGDFVALNACQSASWYGSFTLSRRATFNTPSPSSPVLTRQIRFGGTISASQAIDIMLRVVNVPYTCIYWDLRLVGGTGDELTSRSATHGILLHAMERSQHHGVIRLSRLKGWGVFTGNTRNGSFARLPFIMGSHCGSSPRSTSANKLTAGWSNPVRQGSANVDQTTTLVVDAVPPEDVRGGWVIPVPGGTDTLRHRVKVKIGGYYYRLNNAVVDNGNGTWTITLGAPWLEDSMMTAGSGTLEYAFGGTLGIDGGDYSGMTILGVDSKFCGTSFADRTLYGANLMTNSYAGATAIGAEIGDGPSGAQRAGQIFYTYAEEGQADLEILSMSRNAIRRVHGPTGGDAIPLALDKVSQLTFRRTDGSLDTLTKIPAGWAIYHSLAGFVPIGGWPGLAGLQQRGNGDVVLTEASVTVHDFATTLTANRTATLPPPGRPGREFVIRRSAGGAGTLDVRTSANVSLKVLSAAGEWCQVVDSGTEYELVAAGTS